VGGTSSSALDCRVRASVATGMHTSTADLYQMLVSRCSAKTWSYRAYGSTACTRGSDVRKLAL